MPRYFFFYSGESEGILRADTHAVLHRHGYEIRTILDAGRLEVGEIIPELDFSCLEQCSFKIYAGQLLDFIQCAINDTGTLEKFVNSINWDSLPRKKSENTWCVRVKGDRTF